MSKGNPPFSTQLFKIEFWLQSLLDTHKHWAPGVEFCFAKRKGGGRDSLGAERLRKGRNTDWD